VNLFVLGWNLSPETQQAALSALRGMPKVYPQVDPQTLWQCASREGTVFAAAVHPREEVIAPRKYVAQQGVPGQNECAVLYDGLPVESTAAFRAYRADELLAHWGELEGRLEGQYGLVRVSCDPPQLEVMTDFIGSQPLFYQRLGEAWLISNSVYLIEQITGVGELDALGASTFITFGWVGGGRTLRRSVRPIPPGQRWIWRESDVDPEQRVYCAPTDITNQEHQRLTPEFFERLADEVTLPLRGLSEDFGPVKSALTGGRDSRLIMLLMRRAGLPARYWTAGEPGSLDLEIAGKIAQKLDLPYHVVPLPGAEVVAHWDELCWQAVQRNDGMCNLYQMDNLLDVPDDLERLEVNLWGQGGEAARGYSTGTDFFLNPHSTAGLQRYLADKFIRTHSGIVRPEAVELVEDYIAQSVERFQGMGVTPENVPDIFYLYERIASRGRCNVRSTAPAQDLYSIYTSRAFVRANYSVPVLQRPTEPFHYGLTYLLSPELHGFPYEKDNNGFRKSSWRSQRPVVNMAQMVSNEMKRNARRSLRKAIPRSVRQSLRGARSGNKPVKRQSPSAPSQPPARDRGYWFQSKREQIREMCLDNANCPVWDYVDRAKFDEYTSTPEGPPMQKSEYLGGLYVALTLICYEAFNRAPAS
jgi:hypothetical protein